MTVFAYSISSKDIEFTPSDSEWQVENVEEAIRRLHPFAVDLSSAVEGKDGYKDHDLLVQIVNKVKGIK